MSMPLKEFTGRVVEIAPKYKAIIQFELDNKTERALLWYDKLKINGEPVPEEGTIDNYLDMGTSLKFLCHGFDEKGIDRCRWYITSAWRQSAVDTDMTSDSVLHGLTNCAGQVQKLQRRQGVLSFSNNGEEENVMFLASKLYIGGKRVSAKAKLDKLPSLSEGQYLYFDAVPCEPNDNDYNCLWFATVVWKGKGRKPAMEYDEPRTTSDNKVDESTKALLAEMKRVISNPHSVFLRCLGQVAEIINEEFGLVLANVKNNCWETVLFHRSVATLFDLSLANEDISTIFKEGDRLRIVAASCNKNKYKTRWIASQIRIYVDPSVSHMFQF